MKAPWFVLHLFALIPFLALAENRPVGRSFTTRSEVLAQHGMACTSQPLATQAALSGAPASPYSAGHQWTRASIDSVYPDGNE